MNDHRAPPAWRLPEGVDPPLWQYTHTPRLAAEEDAYFADHPLFRADAGALDERFVTPGRLIDLGCGAGRHAFEAYRRGAHVVAADLDLGELAPVNGMFAAMRAEGEAGPRAAAAAVTADATRLPFPDGTFDRVIASEVLEHVPEDLRALSEITRVLRPGGIAAVTVPSWLPERVCWALSREYHEVPGGHVRIFTRSELTTKLAWAGLRVTGSHHAHGLHSPYWWLKCAVGVHHDKHPAVRGYHRLLVWDIMRRPALTRLTESALNPLIGKSIVIYARKPVIPDGRVLLPAGQPLATKGRAHAAG